MANAFNLARSGHLFGVIDDVVVDVFATPEVLRKVQRVLNEAFPRTPKVEPPREELTEDVFTRCYQRNGEYQCQLKHAHGGLHEHIMQSGTRINWGDGSRVS